MAMAAMNMVSAGGFRGQAFIEEDVRRGSPLYFDRKPPSLGPDDQSYTKLHKLTVHHVLETSRERMPVDRHRLISIRN